MRHILLLTLAGSLVGCHTTVVRRPPAVRPVPPPPPPVVVETWHSEYIPVPRVEVHPHHHLKRPPKARPVAPKPPKARPANPKPNGPKPPPPGKGMKR